MKHDSVPDPLDHFDAPLPSLGKGLIALAALLLLLFMALSVSAATVNVSARDYAFSPKDVTVNIGDTVVWRNTGAMNHTATSGAGCSQDGTFNSGSLSPGETFSFTFTAAGSYPYYCIPHCAFGMTGSVTVAGGPTDAYLYVAAAANARGAQNTDWRTDLMVLNGGPLAETIDLHYTAQGEDGTLEEHTHEFLLQSETAEIFPNIVETLFGLTNSAGNIHLHLRAGAAIFATSRTYNMTALGTYGQFVPGVSSSSRVDSMLLRTHDKGHVAGLLHNEEFRSNLGFAETNGQETAVRIDFYDETGAGVKSYPLVLKPYSWLQMNLTEMELPDAALDQNLRAEVFVESGGGVLAYASVVDNRTGDGVYVPLLREAFIEDKPHQIVAAVARTQGAYGTDWRTETVFFNPFATQTAHLTLVTASGSYASDLEVPSGTIIRVPDLLTELFPGVMGNVSGALHITSARGLVILARIYNLTDDGTYGQFVPALTDAELLAPDEKGFVLQLANNTDYRCNFGLTEMSMVDTEVRVELYDAQGDSLAEREILVPAGRNVQINSVFTAWGVAQSVDVAWAEVEVISGGRIYAYASVADNRTGDAVFSRALKP